MGLGIGPGLADQSEDTNMPFRSKAQQGAMYAAAAGNSTIGIPQKAASSFIADSPKPGKNLPKHVKKRADGGSVEPLSLDTPEARSQFRQELSQGKQRFESGVAKSNVVVPMEFLKGAVQRRAEGGPVVPLPKSDPRTPDDLTQAMNDYSAKVGVPWSQMSAGQMQRFQDKYGATAGRPQPRAKGGRVSGGPYLVGEEGPELFVPERKGTIIPNKHTAHKAMVKRGSISNAKASKHLSKYGGMDSDTTPIDASSR
jgi:hypothetical protein